MDDEAVDDTELMRRYAKGDTGAFERLYRRHRAPLYRYLARHCRPRDAADDVFQDVWSRVIHHRERYEVRASFRTYLYGIAHHCVVDHYRLVARKHLNDMVSVDGDEDSQAMHLAVASHEQPEARAVHDELERAFRAALAALPLEQRDAFLLFEEGGFSLKEIAEIMQVPAETVKSRLRYALGKLRRALAPDHAQVELVAARADS